MPRLPCLTSYSSLRRSADDRMSRRAVGLLLLGWVLGLVTAFVLPPISTQRQTIVGGPTGRLASLADAGWVVMRTDTVGGTPVAQLERPRYMAVIEEVDLWRWELTSTWGGAS